MGVRLGCGGWGVGVWCGVVDGGKVGVWWVGCRGVVWCSGWG